MDIETKVSGGAQVKLLIMEKKGYITPMTASMQTLQRSSSVVRNNKERERVIKYEQER